MDKMNEIIDKVNEMLAVANTDTDDIKWWN